MLSVPATSIVYIIDDQDSIRESLSELAGAAGWCPVTFSSAAEFLSYPRPAVPSCLILDMALPDLDGLELQRRITTKRSHIPIIFLAGDADISTAVRAMKGGAVDFLMKPFDVQVMQREIGEALRRSESALRRENELSVLRADYGLLTHREREVMQLVVSGMLNKQVGGELGISEITVKAHRGNVMRKMKAESFAALVNMSARLRVSRPLITNIPVN